MSDCRPAGRHVIGVGVVLVVFLIVAFYNEVLATAMAGQVQDAIHTGVTADQQRQ